MNPIYTIFHYKNLRPIKDKIVDNIINLNILNLLYKPQRDTPAHKIYTVMRTDMCEIDNGIYLGSSWNAADYYSLFDNNIESILNVTYEISNYFVDYFTYLQVPIKDVSGSSITSQLSTCYEYINSQIKANKRVFIHCFAGSSRSVAVAIYWLMKSKQISFDEAYMIIKSKRSVCSLNMGYKRELENINI
jgi:diacylglycerol kinase (ATP)